MDNEPTPAPADDLQPPPGSWAAVARLMAQLDPEGPDGFRDWDDWKDQMKESES